MRTGASLSNYAFSSPLRLLTTIIDSDVDCSLACDNIITLTTGDVQIVAQPTGDPNAAPDENVTALLQSFIEQMPKELGGLAGMQSIGTLMNVCTGMTALEAVPGEPLKGLSEIWPVDSLSLMIARPDRNARAMILQKQHSPEAASNPLYPGYVQMDESTFFWNPYQPMVDDPYGRASFGPVIAEILGNLHVLQALRDCIDHTAWPRGVIEIDTSQLYDMAQRLGYGDSKDNPAATKYVLDQFQAAVAGFNELKSDDWLFVGANGKAQMMAGGSFAGLEGILDELRSRIVRGLKQLPIMMAYQEGSTEGHTSVQWQVYARRLEAIRAAVLAPILAAFNLHLRLMGLMFTAVAKYQPIRTTDALVEANTRAVTIKNLATECLLGVITPDQMSIELSGTGLVGECTREALLLVAAGKVQAQQTLPAGNTQEEQNANQDQQKAA